MKNSVLVAALLLVSTITFNGFAAEEKKEVTTSELVSEGAKTTFQAALLYGYYANIHDHIMPKEPKSPAGQTMDAVTKAFTGALFGNQVKVFFEKLMLFISQKSKPLTVPLADALKNTF